MTLQRLAIVTDSTGCRDCGRPETWPHAVTCRHDPSGGYHGEPVKGEAEGKRCRACGTTIILGGDRKVFCSERCCQQTHSKRRAGERLALDMAS